MKRKRIILAAAAMSMSLITFMSMSNGRAAVDMFPVGSAAPRAMLAVEGGRNASPVDAIARLEQWK